jgi:hypothetical protein
VATDVNIADRGTLTRSRIEMPSFTCTCGEVISLSEVPNESEFHIFSGWQLENLQTDVASGLGAAATEAQRLSLMNKVLTERHPQPEFIECPSCGRLALFRSPGDASPVNWYISERQPNHSPIGLRGLFAAMHTSRRYPTMAMDRNKLDTFLQRVERISWLAHAGEHGNDAVVADGMQACVDRHGQQMLDVWQPRTHDLENRARAKIGESGIERIFSVVSDAVHQRVYDGLVSYLDRKYGGGADDEGNTQRSADDAVYPEVIDAIKRDVCWAGVESIIGEPGLFTKLLEVYSKGRWPCSWEGPYPGGSPIVL